MFTEWNAYNECCISLRLEQYHRSKLEEAMIQTLFGSLEPEKSAEEEQKSGFFGRMRQAVSRTRESFSARIADIAAMTRTVDESALDELEAVLLTSDLGVPTTTAV